MTEKELIRTLSARAGLTHQQTRSVLHALGESVPGLLSAGESVPLPGVGTLKRVLRPARAVHNPRTKEMGSIPERFAPKLVFSTQLKRAVKD